MRRRLGAIAIFSLLVPLLAAPPALAACRGKTIRGNAKANTLRGTCGPDTIYGLGGNDRLIGLGGNDKLFGGPGNDVLTGGSGKDVLSGATGNDRMNGGAGADTLNGAAGTDTGDGDLGADKAFMGAGDDLFVWNPGDGNDVVEGQGDLDTVRFNGSSAAENFAASPNGDRLYLTRDVGSVLLDVNDVETVSLNPLGGADSATIEDLVAGGASVVNVDLGVASAGDGASDMVTFNGSAAQDSLQAAAVGEVVQVAGPPTQVNVTNSEAANDRLTVNGLGGNDTLSGGALAGLMQLTLDGGDDDDILNGGNGADTLIGGNGADTVDGNVGADTAQMGAGNDIFVWDPGDGSDIVEGQGDSDTLLFNGAAAAEVMTASANGARLSFTRNLGSIVMDTDDIETLTVNALGGADSVTVNDLAATDVTSVNVELGIGSAGDAAADSVVVNGTNAPNVIQASGVGPSVQVTGLAAQVNITNSEAASDRLTVNGLAGNDTLSGGTLATLMQLTLDGGDDDDILNGGNGADTLIGGNGTDTVDGNAGADTGLMGAGNDTFVWDPGDGNDIVEGQGDSDHLLFNASAAAEVMTASANGARLSFTRNLGSIVMDTDDVETLTVNALGGADSVTVNDLSATDVDTVNIDLGVSGNPDLAADSVTVNGRASVDVMSLSGSGGFVSIDSQVLNVAILNSEPANDTLIVNALGGDDLISASSLAASSILLTLNGGDDNDILVGSQWNDTINGDSGDDDIRGGSGDDAINGGDGNDTMDGGAGIDTIDGGPGIDTQTNGEIVTNIP